jgi:protein-tyrosine phosphatase
LGASQLYWITRFDEGHLAIMAAPRLESLEEAILAWKYEGVDTVVSLVEHQEIPGLVEAERALCEEFGLEFLWFPIKDKTVPPSEDDISVLAGKLAKDISGGRSLAIHCRAGVGRSTVLAASVLIQLHIDGGTALDMIAEARGIEVPETEAQRQWVLSFCQTVRQQSGTSC